MGLTSLIQKILHRHNWEGKGDIITLHEPTWSIYYAERTRWRICKTCSLLQRFNHVILSYMAKEEWREYCKQRNFNSWLETIDKDFTIPDDTKIYPRYDRRTSFESRELRKMYGVG